MIILNGVIHTMDGEVIDSGYIRVEQGKIRQVGHMSQLPAGVDLEKACNLQVVPYLYNMPQAMSIADLAVFRAGATGLAELTAKGIPAILIPYPYAAENHQEHNARAVEKAGAAKVILNKDISPELLMETIDDLLEDQGTLRKMAAASRSLGRPQAADTIAEMILELARNRQ